ncbi:MAG: WD40/YVTN/BNR-like repeat-containing protein, partial [Segetibacter sp.]
MRVCLILLSLFYFANTSVLAQKKLRVQSITSGSNTSLRGMSIPSDNVIWVRGSNGTIGKSVDAGKTWRWLIVPEFEKKDFRDIEAFDSSTAI